MNEPTLHVKTLLQLFVLQHLVFGNDESQTSVQDPTGDVGSVVSSYLFFLNEYNSNNFIQRNKEFFTLQKIFELEQTPMG